MKKIAFICHGNICRSPMAEFVFKNMLVSSGREKEFLVVSMATSDEEIFLGVGNTMHSGTVNQLKKHNIPFDKSKRACQVNVADYDKYDLFIGMDNYNIRNLKRLFGGDERGKVHLLLDYAGRHGQEVADPWYTGNFDLTYEDIISGCSGLLSTLGEEK
ncbi:MAG: low molecular weight phosphotyrosine protein phosphatase [Clostridia bacterium]|nr:low molecular weight phosphotyrosine protein phosphatase [Clostridia bacterium]